MSLLTQPEHTSDPRELRGWPSSDQSIFWQDRYRNFLTWHDKNRKSWLFWGNIFLTWRGLIQLEPTQASKILLDTCQKNLSWTHLHFILTMEFNFCEYSWKCIFYLNWFLKLFLNFWFTVYETWSFPQANTLGCHKIKPISPPNQFYAII